MLVKLQCFCCYKENVPPVLPYVFVVVKPLSHVQLFAAPWAAARQVSLSFHHLLEFAQTHVH